MKSANEFVMAAKRVATGQTREGSSHRPMKKKRAQDEINARCSPRRFIGLISQLDDQKKAAVVEMCFGGLLRLQCNRIRYGFCRWLLQHFNPYFIRLELRRDCRIEIVERDVERVFRIPSAGDAVSLSGNDDAVTAWYAALHPSANSRTIMSLTYMEEQLKELQPGPLFKQLFVLYANATILCPSSGGNGNRLLLHSLIDVDQIRSYNWGGYTVQSLVNGVKDLKAEKDTCLCGCVLFLQMFYLDRVTVGPWMVARTYPSIKEWAKKDIIERISKAVAAYGYGVGGVAPPFEATTATDLLDIVEPVIKRIVDQVAEIKRLEDEQVRDTQLLSAMQGHRRNPTGPLYVHSNGTDTAKSRPIGGFERTRYDAGGQDYAGLSTSTFQLSRMGGICSHEATCRSDSIPLPRFPVCDPTRGEKQIKANRRASRLLEEMQSEAALETMLEKELDKKQKLQLEIEDLRKGTRVHWRC